MNQPSQNGIKGCGVLHPLVIAIMLGLSPALSTVAQAETEPMAASALHRFDIPAQPLASALNRFIDVTGWEIGAVAAIIGDRQSSRLLGELAAEQALQQLLQGTGLGYRQAGPNRFVLEPLPQTQDSTMSLAPTTVTGAQDIHDWVYQAPRAVSVITREQLDRSPPRHAADMLVETPGVYSAVSAQDPGLSVNIRGMQDFGRVNTMIDGMRQNFNENGHQQRNGQLYVDSELISNVVIEKGPRSDITGATSIAGSANFGTLSYDDIILPGQDHGVRLRGMTGVGGHGNGVNFIGSAAVAGRLGDSLELLAARSRRSLDRKSVV